MHLPARRAKRRHRLRLANGDPALCGHPIRLLHLSGEGLLAALRLLLEQQLLHFRHLQPDPDAQDDGDDEDGAEHEVLADVGFFLLDEQDAEVDEEDLLGQREEGRDEEVQEFHVAGGEDGGGEVRRDGR